MFGGTSPYARPDYHPSAERHVDILHTALEVTPDWKNRYLYGNAEITAQAYFYPTSIVELDARGMQIEKIQWTDSTTIPLILLEPKWTYENDVIRIDLGRTMYRDRRFTLFIKYTAKPNELRKGGSAAISDDKGLYFIDPDDTDPNIPRQFWTQGETQASSAWFPTIDRPNERMTTEIKMHVDPKLVTLSNGVLAKTYSDADGLKVDHWKMDLPHAPYLVMMAGGDFKVVKDSWRGKEVSYYVEPQFEPYARSIFGNTPAMMEFFSNKLGVEYPWAKYAQICAREYVSGAMENTTATLHSDYLQLDDRELIDGSFEDFISHELFHQWFGDYVTCESWSNLPLNESFATYGEYLWTEYRYGRERADAHHYSSLRGYLREAGVPYDNTRRQWKQEPLIRFNYESQEDMFDRHSYNKGGQVLHMLRLYVGDEAFFASLKLYLETNKFQSVEIHNLRLAFEKVTGYDLNWFFNQWFMSAGHPELDINYSWDGKREMMIVKQTQNFSKGYPVFKLPVNVDIYTGGKVERKSITVDAKTDTFYFDAPTKPDLVNFDADKALLTWKKDHHTEGEWAYMYHHAPRYMDRLEAIDALGDDEKMSPVAKSVIAEALRDHNYELRTAAMYRSGQIVDSLSKQIRDFVLSDSSSQVRAAALYMLSQGKDSALTLSTAKIAVKDSSFTVMGTALRIIMQLNPEEGVNICSQYENDTHREIKMNVASAYAEGGSDAQQPWFERTMFTMYGGTQGGFMFTYATFLKRCNTSTVEKAIGGFERLHKQTVSGTTKFYCGIILRGLGNHYKNLADETALKIEQLGGEKKSNPRIDQLKSDQKEFQRMADLLKGKAKSLEG